MQVERCGQCMHSGGRGKPTQDASNSCVLLAPRTAALMCSSHREAWPLVVTSFAVS
eukprot:COSAG01_NODE_15961_length_1282_cov_9.670330_1_plen_55_part_10